MDLQRLPTAEEIYSLFSNGDPSEVWGKAAEIVVRISPRYDLSLLNSIFNDVVTLFRGNYPNYCAIQTLYHDLSHTMDVFMCAVRLLHGTALAGTKFSDEEITFTLISVLMHDIGYAQRFDENTGTGAQFTRDHVTRGIVFMHYYLEERHLPGDWSLLIDPIMQSTDHRMEFREIAFPNERIRLLGQIVATADIVGQMSDRNYLEKLLYLYLEFDEAEIGGYQGANDLLRKSINFYEATRKKRMDDDLGGIYKNLAHHFRAHFGLDRNYYVESMEKNMNYLSEVLQHDDSECLNMLKRGGIVPKALSIIETRAKPSTGK
jgi:hypothetical protein